MKKKTTQVYKKFLRRGLVFVSWLLVTITIPTLVRAECLGLGLPAPQRTNVCETLVEELVVPKTEVFCDVPTGLPEVLIVPPHCHVPGACHVDPICKAYEVTKQVGTHVLHAGELYCDFREVSPEAMIEGLAQERFTDVVKLTTGGISSVLYQVSTAHIDTLECAAIELSPTLKDVIHNVIEGTALPLNKYFSAIDVDRVRIINRSAPLGDLYLREGFDGITLDSLVIIKDIHHRTLTNWKHNWDEVKFGELSSVEEDALFLMIHELVHVRQYREMGREQFVNQYLAEGLAQGYPDISTEKEARDFQEWSRVEYERKRDTWSGILVGIL